MRVARLSAMVRRPEAQSRAKQVRMNLREANHLSTRYHRTQKAVLRKIVTSLSINEKLTRELMVNFFSRLIS